MCPCPHHTQGLLSCKHSPPSCVICHNWWGYIDTSLSPKIHSLHKGPLLVLYIQCVWTNIQWHVSTVRVPYRDCLENSPHSTCLSPTPSLETTEFGFSFFVCLHSFAFSRMSSHWNCIVCSISVWFLSPSNVHWRSSVSFHGLIVPFFLILNNILSSGCPTVHPLTYEGHLLASNFGNYEESSYKNPCMGISFHQIPRSTIAGLDGKSMFSFIRNCQMVFQNDHTISHPISSEWALCPSMSSPAFGGISVLDFGHSSKSTMVFRCF
jgi:hypothetical protein